MTLESITTSQHTENTGTEEHEFTVSPAFIMHTVKSQSSTLGKAVLENVMNSVDAGATKVEITATKTGLVIVDDGHGFRTREEVLACFSVFGFDHSNHKREFGKFGIGRAQLWAFCRTHWLSHKFLFDVDMETRGLKWFLSSDNPHQEGLRIEATFYKPITNVDLVEFRNELERLVRYSEVPVILNGEQLSKAPQESRWPIVTDEAFLRPADSFFLSVYNQGIFVTDLQVSKVGIGGVLVTKRGHNLSLNVSRNEVMRASCPVWAKLKPEIDKQAKDRATKKRLTDADRDYMASQTAEPENIGNFDRPIITLANGKHVTLSALLKQVLQNQLSLTVAENGSRIAEALTRDNAAVVLSQTTLERFGVPTVAAFMKVVRERLERAAQTGRNIEFDSALHYFQWRDAKVFESIKDCPGYKQLQASKVLEKDLKPDQRLFLNCMEQMRWSVQGVMWRHSQRHSTKREFIIGRGEGMEAYTDGTTYIAIVDTVAEQIMKEGLPGFLRLSNLMVHEYLHDTDDAGSHSHDLQFMEAFHNIVLDNQPELYKGAVAAFRYFTSKKATKTQKMAKMVDVADAQDAHAPAPKD